jgi:hypothetical protein
MQFMNLVFSLPCLQSRFRGPRGPTRSWCSRQGRFSLADSNVRFAKFTEVVLTGRFHEAGLASGDRLILGQQLPQAFLIVVLGK